MKVMTLNVCHSGPDRALAIAAAILAADVDVALLTEFKVGNGGDGLLSALAAGGLTEIIAGPPGAGAYPYTVAIASRLPAEAAALPLDGLPEAASFAEAVVEGISITAVYFPLDDLHVPFWQTRSCHTPQPGWIVRLSSLGTGTQGAAPSTSLRGPCRERLSSRSSPHRGGSMHGGRLTPTNGSTRSSARPGTGSGSTMPSCRRASRRASSGPTTSTRPGRRGCRTIRRYSSASPGMVKAVEPGGRSG